MRQKIRFCFVALFCLFLCVGCKKEKTLSFTGHPSSPYITALADGQYYLEMSMFYNGTIVSNRLAVRDGNIESFSEMQSVDSSSAVQPETTVSHSLRLKDTTYFLDDERKVYFAAHAVGDNGLSGSINYATASYVSSGEDTLMTGLFCSYDEYTVSGKDEETYTLRLYVNEKELRALVLSNGEDFFEQDISVFSDTIPSGMFTLPKDFSEVSEEQYFRDYYGK